MTEETPPPPDVPHHCKPSDYVAMIVRLEQIEAGEISVGNVDWRTTSGVLARMLAFATRPTDASVDAFLREYYEKHVMTGSAEPAGDAASADGAESTAALTKLPSPDVGKLLGALREAIHETYDAVMNIEPHTAWTPCQGRAFGDTAVAEFIKSDEWTAFQTTAVASPDVARLIERLHEWRETFREQLPIGVGSLLKEAADALAALQDNRDAWALLATQAQEGKEAAEVREATLRQERNDAQNQCVSAERELNASFNENEALRQENERLQEMERQLWWPKSLLEHAEKAKAEVETLRQAQARLTEAAFKAGWRSGYYDGGEHDCRMFTPTAERAWTDYLASVDPLPQQEDQ